jgi:hypothetical protein
LDLDRNDTAIRKQVVMNPIMTDSSVDPARPSVGAALHSGERNFSISCSRKIPGDCHTTARQLCGVAGYVIIRESVEDDGLHSLKVQCN